MLPATLPERCGCRACRSLRVELAYAIGVAEPVCVLVDTYGTGAVADDKLAAAVRKVFDLRPTAIIRDLDLRRPIYGSWLLSTATWAARSSASVGGHRPRGSMKAAVAEL